MTPPLPRWPELHPHWRHSLDLARRLNRAGVRAFPIRELPIVAIDPGSEADLPPCSRAPRVRREARRRVDAALEAAGYRIEPGGALRHPRWPTGLQHAEPTATLTEDPSLSAAELLRTVDRILLLPPTETALVLLHHHRGRVEAPLQQELLRLVWELPADLEEVARRAEEAGYRRVPSILPPLWTQQRRGIEARRAGRFRSELPR